MTQRKQKTVNPKANGIYSELIITIEKLPTHKLTAYKPQGDYAPYKNCQTSSNLAHLGSISADKDTQKSIGRLRKLLKDWNIDNPHTFALIVSNNISAEPSQERVVSAEDADEISYYLNLPEYSLRIGLHNLNTENYKGSRNRQMNYGVTFKDFTKKDTFREKKGVKVKAYVYVYFTQERLKLIAKAILYLLENGEWDDSIAKADYENPSSLDGEISNSCFR
ncbi:MAG: hypothetical protein IKR17_02010 [Bacteroidales bacterium]|nr:hypothetical protein [Bacteroidales bacterium]